MAVSAIWAIWRDWALGIVAALSAALSAYWSSAPNLLRIAAYALGPLWILESLTAVWMQSHARRRGEAAVGESGVTIYPDDTWARAGMRFGMTLLLVALAAAVDAVLGTRHMTVLWVALWGTSGHARGTLRHLEAIARLNHMKLPIFPDDKLQRLDALTAADPAPTTAGDEE